MSVLALVRKPEEVTLVTTWASEFAAARETSLTVLCWARSPMAVDPESEAAEQCEGLEVVEELAAAVRREFDLIAEDAYQRRLTLPQDSMELRRVLHPDSVAAMLRRIRAEEPELVVAAADDHTGRVGATYSTNKLLRQSPCNTIILFGNRPPEKGKPRVLVGATDNPHDVASVYLASRMAKAHDMQVTIARAEQGGDKQAIALGRRELKQLMRDAGVKPRERLERLVVPLGHVSEISAEMEQRDLVLFGANNQRVVRLSLEVTDRPVIGVVKRAPPLRGWHRKKRHPEWNPRLSPADYVDLIQGLRHGSRLSVDFLVMLGLASAIASLGLLQDSPAVVIGSMLLAPLMTPMIGTGLSLAQANPGLGKNALVSIFSGFMLTLVVSFTVAVITPGEEMTSQVIARGDPNILDLMIALFSSCAAAYALARPNLVGAVAGVAIATALVPPLCSAGISFAYGQYEIAHGAAMLFATNLVAIILGAAATFRYLGVTSAEAGTAQRRWVYRTLGILGIAVIALIIPLQRALERNIERGKPQPATYPLTKSVKEAVVEHIELTPEVELVAAGRPSSLHDESDVVIILMSPRPLDDSLAHELRDLVRLEMSDPTLIVEVHCLQEAWRTQKDSPPKQR